MQIIHSLLWYLIYKLKSEKIFRIISYPSKPCHLSTGYFLNRALQFSFLLEMLR